jgi:hypothetical protein
MNAWFYEKHEYHDEVRRLLFKRNLRNNELLHALKQSLPVEISVDRKHGDANKQTWGILTSKTQTRKPHPIRSTVA